MHRISGFTLIELMIVVVVLGILIAVGFPSYQAAILKTKRADCQSVMLNYANALERRYTATKTYDGGAMDFACPSNVDTADSTSRRTYNLTLATADTTYTLTATPVSPQTKEKCGVLTLNNTGKKTSSGAAVKECW